MELKAFVEQNPKVLLSEKKTRALLNDIYMNDQFSINLMTNAVLNAKKMYTYLRGYAMGQKMQQTLTALKFTREKHKNQT